MLKYVVSELTRHLMGDLCDISFEMYFSDALGTRCKPRGRDETLGGPEESRWTKSQHICIRICVQITHVYTCAGKRDEIWTGCFFFIHFLPKKKRCERKTETLNPSYIEPQSRILKYLFQSNKSNLSSWAWAHFRSITDPAHPDRALSLTISARKCASAEGHLKVFISEYARDKDFGTYLCER